MRLAIDGRYIQDYFPGIARHTYNLVESLAKIVEEQLILLYNPSSANTRYDLRRLEDTGRVGLLRVDVPAFSPAEQVAIPLLLARQGIEVFHSPYYIKPHFQTSRSVVSIHDVIMKLYPEDTPSKKARMAFDLAVRLSLWSSRKVIAVSEFSKATLVEHFRARPEKIAVVYNGVDSRFHPRDVGELAHLRQVLGLPARFALYVGINKPHKNLVRLIEAFAIVRREADIDLVIAGKEDLRYPQARVAAEKTGTYEHVLFLGDVAEECLPGLYNLAEAFVFPSLSEGFGLPVLEAMASGVPVACSGTSSLPEVAGDAALLFDPQNVEDIARAISRITGDAGLRASLGENAVRRARLFTWKVAASRTLEVYREALT